MSDLWSDKRASSAAAVMPLAMRMRPRTLEEFVGQEQILGEGRLLRRMLNADAITSLILHGPPGTGKTTLAEVIANATRRHFERENAASVGVKRIREIIENAEDRLATSEQRTILFLDEIHRFSKAQQDVLLPDTERGVITLIGATTENPLFACNSALVSRSTLFRLELLTVEQIKEVVRRAVRDPRGYGGLDLTVREEALDVWAVKSEGDARRALTALEVAVLSQSEQARERTSEQGETTQSPSLAGSLSRSLAPIHIDRPTAEDSIQRKAMAYSVTGDSHYDMISAMIKSVRGSDPDAAVYWIAAMLEGGEDPRFIARRLAILASEDIGNADPRAIVVAQSGWDLAERIGMPEARITLAQVATYLALAPKSNASYVAIDEAMADVRDGRTVPVPYFLQDGNTSPIGAQEGAEAQKRKGRGYEYSHDAEDGVTGQDYLGVEKRYYRPGVSGVEKMLSERLEEIRGLRERKRRGKGQ